MRVSNEHKINPYLYEVENGPPFPFTVIILLEKILEYASPEKDPPRNFSSSVGYLPINV